MQPIKEAALGNIPTIAFCDTDSPMRYVDIAIPANNKGRHSIGCLYWMLARMVLQMRGTIRSGQKWDVMVSSLAPTTLGCYFLAGLDSFCFLLWSLNYANSQN